MKQILIKIKGEDLTLEHMRSGTLYIFTSPNNRIRKNDDGTYYLPYSTGFKLPENEALNWFKSAPYQWVRSFDTLEEAKNLLADPIWSKARLDHDLSFNRYGEHTKALYEQGPMRCDCCNNLIGYFYHDTYNIDNFVCLDCMKNCAKDRK